MIEEDKGFWCVECGEEVLPKRAAFLMENKKPLTCLRCGENAAQAIMRQREKQVVPGHKSNLMLITGKTVAERRQFVLGTVNKTGYGIKE